MFFSVFIRKERHLWRVSDPAVLGESRINPFYLVGPDKLCKSFEEVYVLLVKEYSEQLLSDPELARKHDQYVMREQKLKRRKGKPKQKRRKK